MPEARFLVGESEKHKIRIRLLWDPSETVTIDVDDKRVIDTGWGSGFSKTITFSVGEQEKHEVRFEPPTWFELYIDGRRVSPTSLVHEVNGGWYQDIDALCVHLIRLGLDATVDLKEDKNTDVYVDDARIMGSVRIANRNIDFVELRRWDWNTGGDQPEYYTKFGCFFVVQATVEGLKDGRVAEGNPVKSFITLQVGEKVVDFTWEGKDLARILNSDAELKRYLLSQRKLPHLVIYKRQHVIRIGQKLSGWLPTAGYDSPTAAFPTAETFEAYDRIAQHIRSIATVR